MSTTSMSIRTDVEIKRQAEELFSEFGLNMTTAINMFLRQVVRNKAIPLELSINPTVIGKSAGGHVYTGEGKKDFFDLVGKIEFADEYDYKELRRSESDSSRYISVG